MQTRIPQSLKGRKDAEGQQGWLPRACETAFQILHAEYGRASSNLGVCGGKFPARLVEMQPTRVWGAAKERVIDTAKSPVSEKEKKKQFVCLRIG